MDKGNKPFVRVRINREVWQRLQELAELKRNQGIQGQWSSTTAAINYALEDYMDTIGDASLEYEADRAIEQSFRDLGLPKPPESQLLN